MSKVITVDKLRRTIKAFASIVVAVSVGLLLSGITGINLSAQVAAADAPPQTVSADPLPSVQTDGIVWAQVTVGNIVYATGHFSEARPAGVALHGTGSVTRSNLLAYNITTGQLDTTFVHSLTIPAAEQSGVRNGGQSIAASPDGKRLYVGGRFTQADGQAVNNFAVFDLTTNKLMAGFTGPNYRVLAIAATSSTVYVGGEFTSVGTEPRKGLAAYSTSGSLLSTWRADLDANGTTWSLLALADKLIVGGSFNMIAGKTYYSSGAVSLTTGAPLAWASSSVTYPIRDQMVQPHAATTKTYISSLSTDGNLVFLTSEGDGSAELLNFFEGTAAISPTDGSIVWINDCHGNTHNAFPMNGVLYSASHAHDCTQMGGWNEYELANNAYGSTHQFALAQSISGITGTNTAPYMTKYTSFAGTPHTSILNWYPNLKPSPLANEAAWSITGNGTYLAVAGEFTQVNGLAQQGIVRYTIRTSAPNKVAPRAYLQPISLGHKPNAAGKAIVSIRTTWDPDDTTLTYRLYRDNGTTPLHTFTAESTFAAPAQYQYIDSGLTPGSSHTYKLTVTDPRGNMMATSWIPNNAKKVHNDWDGDGAADASSTVKTSTGIKWYTNPASPSQITATYGIPGDVAIPADYTGDGIMDMTVFRPSNGTWYIRNQPTVAFGRSTDIPVPADYNGDGKVDIAVFRPSDGTWYVRGISTTPFGRSTDIPVPADYTGDGKADIAVWRPSEHKLFIKDVSSMAMGTSTDIPVPADYNGDGKVELALYRPSTGHWFITSPLSGVALKTVQYGNTGYVPFPADFTGDGRADVSVWRPNNTYAIQGYISTTTAYGTAPTALPYAVGHAYFSTRY